MSIDAGKQEQKPLTAEQAELIELARNSQRQRREAPEVTTEGQLQIPQRQIIRRFETRDTQKGEKGFWKYGFTTPDKLRRRAEEGCEPEIKGGEYVRFGSDILVKRATDLWKQREQRRCMLAARQANAAMPKKGAGVIPEESGASVVAKADKQAILNASRKSPTSD